jgi:hypothetical protein
MTRRLLAIAIVIAAGLLSRAVHTGWILFDKYLGDALYAVMIYLLLPSQPVARRAALAMAIMMGIELFQLTNIPFKMVADSRWPVRVVGRLLGTTFGWGDLAAYAAGIVALTRSRLAIL